MLKCLVSALLGEKKETKSHSLAYATYKAGTHDPKCKNQSFEFSAMKGEMKGKHKCKVKTDLCCKSLTSAEKVSEHILKESLIMWNQKQGNQGRVTNKVCANKDKKREKISPSTDSLAKDLIVSTLMLIQYHLTQQAKGKDICEEDCPGSSMGYMSQQSTQYEKCGSGQSTKSLSMKHFESRGAAGPSAYGKESQLDSQKLDMSNMVLSLIQKLLSESPFNCDEPPESDKRSDPRSSKAAPMSKRPEDQCPDNSEMDFISGMKQMNHQFIDQRLPEVSAKAAGKGYCVGDLLLEVMKFAKERQLDEANGNMARKQLLDWLLANLARGRCPSPCLCLEYQCPAVDRGNRDLPRSVFSSISADKPPPPQWQGGGLAGTGADSKTSPVSRSGVGSLFGSWANSDDGPGSGYGPALESVLGQILEPAPGPALGQVLRPALIPDLSLVLGPALGSALGLIMRLFLWLILELALDRVPEQALVLVLVLVLVEELAAAEPVVELEAVVPSSGDSASCSPS
ncbi:A-kinase anchor protein 4 [Lemmus lemmus]